MEIYCLKHDEVHKITQARGERLLYQYQVRIVEAATSEPLPPSDIFSPENILKTAFCVMEDDKPSNVIPQWRTYVDRCLGRRRAIRHAEAQAKVRRKKLADRAI